MNSKIRKHISQNDLTLKDKWTLKREGEGWKHLTFFIHPQLAVDVKQFIRQWKFEHPEIYR
jgi:hypothetical protein